MKLIPTSILLTISIPVFANISFIKNDNLKIDGLEKINLQENKCGISADNRSITYCPKENTTYGFDNDHTNGIYFNKYRGELTGTTVYIKNIKYGSDYKDIGKDNYGEFQLQNNDSIKMTCPKGYRIPKEYSKYVSNHYPDSGSDGFANSKGEGENIHIPLEIYDYQKTKSFTYWATNDENNWLRYATENNYNKTNIGTDFLEFGHHLKYDGHREMYITCIKN